MSKNPLSAALHEFREFWRKAFDVNKPERVKALPPLPGRPGGSRPR